MVLTHILEAARDTSNSDIPSITCKVPYTFSLRIPPTLVTMTLNSATLPCTRWRKASMFMVFQVRVVQPGRKLRTTTSMCGITRGKRAGSIEDTKE